MVYTKKNLDGPAPADVASMLKNLCFMAPHIHYVVRLTVYNLEKALRLCRLTGHWQIMWVIDLNGYSRKNSPPLAYTYASSSGLSNVWMLFTSMLLIAFWCVVCVIALVVLTLSSDLLFLPVPACSHLCARV